MPRGVVLPNQALPLAERSRRELGTGWMIRDYLYTMRRGTCAAAYRYVRYRCMQEGLQCGSYDSFRNYWFKLKACGVIEKVEETPIDPPPVRVMPNGEPSRRLIRVKAYYRIVRGRYNDRAWLNPYKVLYPNLRTGRAAMTGERKTQLERNAEVQRTWPDTRLPAGERRSRRQ
jgi:hypothetical protein